MCVCCAVIAGRSTCAWRSSDRLQFHARRLPTDFNDVDAGRFGRPAATLVDWMYKNMACIVKANPSSWLDQRSHPHHCEGFMLAKLVAFSVDRSTEATRRNLARGLASFGIILKYIQLHVRRKCRPGECARESMTAKDCTLIVVARTSQTHTHPIIYATCADATWPKLYRHQTLVERDTHDNEYNARALELLARSLTPLTNTKS